MRIKRRAWIFVVILAVGDVVGFGVTQAYAGIDRGFEAVSLVTAFLTAGYAVVAEASSKQLPLLRITPKAISGRGLGSLGFTVDVDNIGSSVAMSTHIECRVLEQIPAQLVNSGVFNLDPIAPGERTTLTVIDDVSTQSIASRTYQITADYKDSENESMNQIVKIAQFQPLIEELLRRTLQRR